MRSRSPRSRLLALSKQYLKNESSTYRASSIGHLSQKHRRTADLSRFRRRRLAHRSARTARARIRERNQRRSRCDLQNSNRLTVQRPRRSQTVARSNGNKYSAAKTAANQRELREKNGRHRRGPPPRGTAQLAQGPPHRLRGAAEEQGRRVDGPAELGRAAAALYFPSTCRVDGVAGTPARRRRDPTARRS